MPKKAGFKTYNDLINAPIPAQTKTYRPVEHQWVIDNIQSTLEQAGYEITESIYRGNDECTQVYGYYTFRIKDENFVEGEDEQIEGVYAFQNSYDKTMKFRGSAGAKLDNGAIILTDSTDYTRKHTGAALPNILNYIHTQVANIRLAYFHAKNIRTDFKDINLTKAEVGRAIGEMTIYKILSPDQSTKFYQEWRGCAGTLWDVFKVVTLVLQNIAPRQWMDTQFNAYNFILGMEVATASIQDGFDNTTIDDPDDLIDLNSNEEYTDPNQVDLEDSIAEVEADDTVVDPIEDPIADERKAEWDQQTRLEEGFDHKGGLTNDELAADAEMQEMKTEQILQQKADEDVVMTDEEDEIATKEAEEFENMKAEEVEFPPQADVDEEDESPVWDEDQIAERIREDEEAIAHVCDEKYTTTYLPKDDFCFAEVGDAVEVDGLYYELKGSDVVEGEEFWLAKEIVEEPKQPELDIELDVPEIQLPIQEIPIQDITKEDIITRPSSTMEDLAVKQIIKEEIADVYGEEQEFTYEQSEDKYVIKLDSGAIFKLDTTYIDSKKLD